MQCHSQVFWDKASSPVKNKHVRAVLADSTEEQISIFREGMKWLAVAMVFSIMITHVHKIAYHTFLA